MTRIDIVKEQINSLYQARNPTRADWADWLYGNHVFVVAEEARRLADRFGADKELAMAAGMLHDVADAVMSRFDARHGEESERMAREILRNAGFTPGEITIVVDDAINLHGCHENSPQSLEGKVIATADAVVHLTTDFYDYALATMKKVKSLEEIQKWALPKIERDFNAKICFEEVRHEVRDAYEQRKAAFSRT